MSVLILGGEDVSKFLPPSGLNVDYANKYSGEFTTAEGKEVKKIIGQTVTVTAELKMVDDESLQKLKTAIGTGVKYAVSGDEIPSSSDYGTVSFKQTLAYKTTVNFWDVSVTVSCYIVSDGL